MPDGLLVGLYGLVCILLPLAALAAAAAGRPLLALVIGGIALAIALVGYFRLRRRIRRTS